MQVEAIRNLRGTEAGLDLLRLRKKKMVRESLPNLVPKRQANIEKCREPQRDARKTVSDS